jgi:hypothetical protein
MSGDQQLIALVGVVLVIVVAVTVYRPYLQAVIFGGTAKTKTAPPLTVHPFGVPYTPVIA